MPALDAEMRLPSLPELRSALASFASSPSSFRLLHSVPPQPSASSRHAETLYVLDSSFNPPTRAHLKIAASAVGEHDGAPPKRLLLLLAVRNADKASQPAPFEQRLALMTAFARDLLAHLRLSAPAASAPGVDVGVTKLPYFHDKAEAISRSSMYASPSADGPEQVHLVGFDTLIRILNTKYYPPSHTLAPLTPFLRRHRLRVTHRADADWGGREEQRAYVADLADGKREEDGGRREWADKIELVKGTAEGGEVVSSTKVREAVRTGDLDALRRLVTEAVAAWIVQEGLYRDPE
ncbi:MAG: hypothetical protein M1832_000111 [Thelocarpon impressellum]|nr:MAG: hypothetical protein M1832_000111 [Thelocarpon impressellum]